MNQPSNANLPATNDTNGAVDAEDADVDRYDYDRESRKRFLAEEIRLREGDLYRCGPFSATHVLETAAARCFELMAMELRALDGFLTESELVAVLNATPHPVWTWRGEVSMAGAVADAYGIETLNDDSPMTPLVKKLLQLTPVQCLALVDLCERIWRSPMNRPISDIAAEHGLALA